MDFGNSTEKLLYKVLSAVIPQETIQFLQPDNLRKLITAIGAKLNSIQEQQDRIEKTQQEILDILNGRDNGSSVVNGQFRVVSDGTGTDG